MPFTRNGVTVQVATLISASRLTATPPTLVNWPPMKTVLPSGAAFTAYTAAVPPLKATGS